MLDTNKCQIGLEYLLKKYNVCNVGKLSKENIAIETEGKTIPLLPWRNERRFIELKNLVNDGTLEGISVMRVYRIEKDGEDLESIIYRELDLCEWILGSSVESIYTVQNGEKAANIIAKLKSGIVCTIEVAVTLPKEAKIIDKHEIISQRGVACDRVVDTQVPQQSIYVFADIKEPKTYLDVDFELYGYDTEEAAVVRQAFEMMKNPVLADTLIKSAKHLSNLIKMSKKSVQIQRVSSVEEI